LAAEDAGGKVRMVCGPRENGGKRKRNAAAKETRSAALKGKEEVECAETVDTKERWLSGEEAKSCQ